MRSLKKYNRKNPWLEIGQGEYTVFRSYVKFAEDDADDFYGYSVNPFYCYILPLTKYKTPYWNTTHFCISSVDDWGIHATFNYAMTREEATKICREFMRSFKRTSRSFGGLTQDHFEKFFKEKGADEISRG
jgi:hypothetical protein